MSRIGGLPIIIPTGVTVETTGSVLAVKGPKGSLSLKVVPEIKIVREDHKILLKRKNDQKRVKALHGLMRSLIANMVIGVTEGFSKTLELMGVGFRAAGGGNKLTLNVGFSHPVEVVASEGINLEVLENTKIKISGIDKQLVGQVAKNIRAIRPPDVYKGKGIRYQGEYVRKKLGKAAKAGVGGVTGK